MDIEFYEGYSDILILGTVGDVAPIKGDYVVVGSTKYLVDDIVVVYDPHKACDNVGNVYLRHTQRACVSLSVVCPANHGGLARLVRKS